uniref:Uncharacterized protein n=1 Tax=Arundo donax TaxID=35708 RepID=A0A0A9GKN0_ARUDO
MVLAGNCADDATAVLGTAARAGGGRPAGQQQQGQVGSAEAVSAVG